MGEISTKNEYFDNNNLTYRGKIKNISENKEFDAASSLWGGNWRIPTYEEMKELLTKCQWSYYIYKDRPGYKITGPNGNSIFLPMAGFYIGKTCYSVNEYGSYWCSTSNQSDFKSAYYLNIYDNKIMIDLGNRSYGRSIRPVIK